MSARRSPRPGPGKDFRAVAADRPQRRLPLPVIDDRADPDALADVELVVRRRAGGGRSLRVRVDAVLVDAAVVRRLAERLGRAADALEGDAP